MRVYARIDRGMVMELFETDGDIVKMFHPSLVWVDVTDESPRPEQNWGATEAEGAWKFSAPIQP